MFSKVLTLLTLASIGASAFAQTTPEKSLNRRDIDRTAAAIDANAICASLQERAKILTTEILRQNEQADVTVSPEAVKNIEAVRNQCENYSNLVNYLLTQLGSDYYYAGATLNGGLEANLGRRLMPGLGANVGAKFSVGPYIMIGNKFTAGIGYAVTGTPLSFSQAVSSPLEPFVGFTVFLAFRHGIKSIDDLSGYYVGPGGDMATPFASLFTAKTTMSGTVLIHTSRPIIAVAFQIPKWSGKDSPRSGDFHIDVMKYIINNPGKDGRAAELAWNDQARLTDFWARLKELAINFN